MIRAADRPSRRTLLTAAAVTAASASAAVTAGCSAQQPSARPSTAVAATGRYQAGITTPRTPQPNLLAVVTDVAPSVAVGRLLADLGDTILELTSGKSPRLLGLEPGDLTITVGVGPGLMRMVAGRKAAGAELAGTTDLPAFAHEVVEPGARGGDVLLQICASDPLVLSVVAAALLERAGGRLAERWRQSARRGPSVPVAEGLTAPRNQLGFIDGIVGPHTDDEQERDLWLAAPNEVAGGTIAVVRRMELDLRRFAGLSPAAQEAVMGRHRDTGIPLSGGVVADGPDLGAKTPDGRYLVPAGAHARRAHAAVVGVGLMLRRSYSIDEPNPGLLFISFQNSLRTFTATLTHMENGDALLPFTRTTASATFLILPGFDQQRPLGSTLF